MIHVYPLNDQREHDTEEVGCPCGPRVEAVEEECLVVHNSFDGREFVEQGVDGAFSANGMN